MSVRFTAPIRRQTKTGCLTRLKIKCQEKIKCFQKPTVFDPQTTQNDHGSKKKGLLPVSAYNPRNKRVKTAKIKTNKNETKLRI